MRIAFWVRAKIMEWLGLGLIGLAVDDDGGIAFTYPHPDAIARRKRLKA
jgi:hypothetical protein